MNSADLTALRRLNAQFGGCCIEGPTGPAGPTGPTGQTGPLGPQGEQGIAFTVSAQGPTGSGQSGPTYTRDYYNAQSAGFSFLETTNGFLYLKNTNTSGDWSPGISFGRGPTGTQGIQGIVGVTGYTGPTGVIGPAGVPGNRGPTGPTGQRGPTGTRGLMGNKGDTGPRGQSGESILTTNNVFTGTNTFNNIIINPVLRAWTEDSTSITVNGSVQNLNLALSNNFILTLNTNITSLTFTNIPASSRVCTVHVWIIQGAGSNTIVWPVSFTWGAAGAPTLTSTVGKADMIQIVTYNGGTNWYAFTLGQNFL